VCLLFLASVQFSLLGLPQGRIPGSPYERSGVKPPTNVIFLAVLGGGGAGAGRPDKFNFLWCVAPPPPPVTSPALAKVREFGDLMIDWMPLQCRHNWGRWVMVLNELTPGLKEKVAPTDCRLRPDQHYMETGEFDKVSLLHIGAVRGCPFRECVFQPWSAAQTTSGLKLYCAWGLVDTAPCCHTNEEACHVTGRHVNATRWRQLQNQPHIRFK